LIKGVLWEVIEKDFYFGFIGDNDSYVQYRRRIGEINKIKSELK